MTEPTQPVLPFNRPITDPDVIRKAATTATPKRSAATERAYRSDWADFSAWCERNDQRLLPAEPATIVEYLLSQVDVGHKPSTLARRTAAIGAAHTDRGLPNPGSTQIVRSTLRAIKDLGAQATPVTPLTVDELRRMADTCVRSTPIGARDAALLLIGFAGGYTRSELVAIDVHHVEERSGGRLHIAGGPSRIIGPGRHALTCPVQALEHWREMAGIDDGPVFRPIHRDNTVGASRLSDRAVARAVARCADRAELPEGRHFAAHSLRAGFIAAALAAGIPERVVARHTGLAPAGSALTDYARRAGQGTPPEHPLDIGL